MEIQNVSSFQTICVNGSKIWRVYDPSEDRFKMFTKLTETSQMIASSNDFILIADEDEHVWLFKRKDFSWKQIFMEGNFLSSVFEDGVRDFLAIIHLPTFEAAQNLLICQDKIFVCSSYQKLDDCNFQAKVIENGEEKKLTAWIGSDKKLLFYLS